MIFTSSTAMQYSRARCSFSSLHLAPSEEVFACASSRDSKRTEAIPPHTMRPDLYNLRTRYKKRSLKC